MTGLELILVLLAVSAALQVLARRWHLPHPVLLVIGGAALAFAPGLPRPTLDPEVTFLVFVPPLLYWTAFTLSYREFKREFWPILRLGVLLVLVTMCAVAWTAHQLTPEFTWPAAFALGAIIAPPDPIAATAVMRPLGAPAALVSILEGEGLVNDATALVSYRVAVAAAVTGSFSPSSATLGVLIAGAGGVAVGLAAGWLIGRVRRQIGGLPLVGNTLSLLTPFVAYLPADAIGASGVLAVVMVGVYLGRHGPRITTPATRVQAEAMWTMLAFLLESLIFILVGLALRDAIQGVRHHSPGTLLRYTVLVSGVVIGVRLLWVFPSAYLPRLLTRRRDASDHRPRELPQWRWVAFIGWAGMRGGDSLVIALALPVATATGAPFPARHLIIFVTFAVIFVTLIVQGLTLRPFLRALGIGDGNRAESEEAHARRVATDAALRQLEKIAANDGGHPETVRYLRATHQRRKRRWTARDRERHEVDDAEHRALEPIDEDSAEAESATYRRLRTEMIGAERRAIIDLRDRGVIGDDVMRRIQRDLDLETMMLESAADGAPESPYTL